MNHLNLQLNLCKYFPDWPADTKICLHSSRCLTFINDHKIFSTEIINKSSCRINNKGCSPDDQHICLADRPDRTPDHTAVQALLIQNNIRLNDSSTDTSRNSFCFLHGGCVIELSTFLTVISMNASMQFQHLFTPRFLVQTIDILRDHRSQFPHMLQLCQLFVGWIRLRSRNIIFSL